MRAFEIGPLSFNLYSLMILIGVVFAIMYGKYQLAKKDLNPEKFDGLVLFVFLIGVLGARTWYVVSNLDLYTSSKDPLLEMLSV